MARDEVIRSDQSIKLSAVNDSDFHKAWHLLGLLLTIGRPVHMALFPAPPEMVDYLCSIPNSPIRLTDNLFVTLSLASVSAFQQFVENSNTVTPIVRRLGLSSIGPKRIWKHVDITYCRKRRKVIPEPINIPVMKDGIFSLIVKEEKNNGIVLALPCKAEDAGSMDMSRKLLTQADTKLENHIQAIATTSNDSRYFNDLENERGFGNFESFPHCLDVITEERTNGCITNPEALVETSKMENQGVVIEDTNKNCSYRRTQIDLNAPPCSEEDNPMMLLPAEDENVNVNNNCKDIIKSAEDERDNPMKLLPAEDENVNVNNDCNNTAKSAEDERDKEHKLSFENLQINTAYVSDSCEDGLRAKSIAKEISKTVKKESLVPPQKVLNRTIGKSILGANVNQEHKRPYSIKLKIPNNSVQMTVDKEKKDGSTKEKPTLTPIKIQPDPKVLPNFESFIVKEEEGSGGYGTVYRAQRKSDNATLAIKCPHANANRHHVQNELKMLERFGGKNFVIKYEGSFKNGDGDCLVLEHVEHDRPEVLRKEVDAFQLQWYGYCLFRALASLHRQGVVHRDVKPGNFLFSREANKGYLIDFNLAVDMQQKYGTTDRSTGGYDANNTNSLPPTKNRKFPPTKALESLTNQDQTKASRSLVLPKNLKRKTDQISVNRKNMMKSQGADGSGITSAKEGTSSRIPSGEKLREPLPSQGRKELISLVQEAMQGPNHEATSVPSSKRKRVAAPPERVQSKVLHFTPMPLHSTGLAIPGSGMHKNRGEGKHKREGPCVGTKGFRAPEVLFRSQYQGPKMDVWSAGVTLLYLITGRSPFVGDPEQNIKEIAKLKGSEELWEVAKLHNREQSFPPILFDVQYLASTKVRDWCKQITRRPEFHETLPRSLFDLLDKCLTVNPRVRISAEEALRHDFFASCQSLLRKQRLLRQQGSTSFDSAAANEQF